MQEERNQDLLVEGHQTGKIKNHEPHEEGPEKPETKTEKEKKAKKPGSSRRLVSSIIYLLDPGCFLLVFLVFWFFLFFWFGAP